MNDAEKWMLLTALATDTRRMVTTRSLDVVLSRSGAELARKTLIYKRHKPVSTDYLFFPDGNTLLAKPHEVAPKAVQS